MQPPGGHRKQTSGETPGGTLSKSQGQGGRGGSGEEEGGEEGPAALSRG